MNWSIASSSLRFFVLGVKCLGLVRDFEEIFLDGNCLAVVFERLVGEHLTGDD